MPVDDAAIARARTMLEDAGFSDPPPLLIDVIAGAPSEADRIALVSQTTAEQVRRLRVLQGSAAGFLTLWITDWVAAELDDLRRQRILRRTHGEM